ncbi:MAG: beta-N-acetylhexosaminidase [Ketobacter sp.]|nr:beta-N-acetylhexosaminidase [Ketobacter sp.]
MQQRKAVIFGWEGLTPANDELAFFSEHQPWGFIIFARNIESPEQVRHSITLLQEALHDPLLPVLIDQEGGRVARLGPPHWRKPPAAKVFADLAAKNAETAAQATFLNARLMAEELRSLGITVDCAPVADIPVPGSHDIIGDRAYGTEPQQVIQLAKATADGLLEGGVLPIIKHIPGHGRALVDSHEDLPVVDAKLETLEASDFVPFKQLAHLPAAMTAHIRFTALDEKDPVTLSPAGIRYIREQIGFDGLLMSDDVSMKALQGEMDELTAKILHAGCDMVLHCNGKMEEMRPIAEVATLLEGKALERADKARAAITPVSSFDAAQASETLAELLAA